MNLANKITLMRLVILPIIIIILLLYYYNAFTATIDSKNYSLPVAFLVSGILFIVASITDFLDGYVARKYNQVTTLGKFFDSIADKILINGVLIVFAVLCIVPVYITIILILRDFIIDVVRQILAKKDVIMAANNLGRIKAAVEMIGLSLLFFINFIFLNGTTNSNNWNDEYGYANQLILIPMYLATILSIISATVYIKNNWHLLLK